MVADVIKSFDTVDRSILHCAQGRLGCLLGSGRFILLIIVRCRDGGKPQGCLLSMVFIVALCSLVPALGRHAPSFMLTTSSAVLSVPMPPLVLLSSLLSMSGLSVRMSPLGSVFSLAAPSLLGEL